MSFLWLLGGGIMSSLSWLIDALPNFALLGIARLDGKRAILVLPECALGGIEPQLRLPLLRVESMAREAVLRKYRADIAIELELFLRECREAKERRGDSGKARLRRKWKGEISSCDEEGAKERCAKLLQS